MMNKILITKWANKILKKLTLTKQTSIIHNIGKLTKLCQLSTK